MHFTRKSAMVSYHILIIFPANSMTTQLQKLWIFYYIPIYYSSVLLRSLYYWRPGLIIRLESKILW